MFKRLRLRNFQKHQRLDIQLDPLVTTLCGVTDAGKSTILKALQWACLNVPSGVDFISHGKTLGQVTLTADGHQVKRIRNASSHNAYRLGVQTFKAFKNNVPDEIAKLLNVTDLNFQNQDDPRFWLSLSPGELSKELNKLIQLDVIDRSIGYLAKHARQTQAERSVAHDRLVQAKTERDRLADAPTMNGELTAINALENRLKTHREKVALLARLAEMASDAARTARNAGNATIGAGKLAGIGAEHRAIAARRKRLTGLVTSTVKSRMYVRRPFPDIEAMITARNEADVFAERNRLIRMLVDDITSTRSVLCQVKSDLEIAERHMNRLAPQSVKCPKCGLAFSPSPSATVTSPTRCRHAATTLTGTAPKKNTATNSKR